MSTAEAAAYSGFSEHTIRDAVSAGHLQGVRRPTPRGWGHWRFTAEQIDAWLTKYATSPRKRAS